VAIFYRAVWADRESGVIDRAVDLFCSWVREKSDGVLAATTAEERSDDGAFSFRLQDVMADDAAEPVTRAVRGTFVENKSNGARWTTTLRAWTGPQVWSEARQDESWLWVDVDAVSHDSLDGVFPAAPRFVRDAIEHGAEPNRRGIPLSAAPRLFHGEQGAESLASLLTDVDRDIPVVVFSQPPSWFVARDLPPGRSVDDMHEAAMNRAAHRVAGHALVCQVDDAGSKALAGAIGESYSVRDGAFRIYVPGVDPALDEEWRHRYTVLARYVRNVNAAGNLIGRATLLKAGTRRPPDSYEAAVKLLGSVEEAEPRELAELLTVADEEIAQLREDLAAQDQVYLALVDDHQGLEAENNSLRSKLNVARRKLVLIEPDLWRTQPGSMRQIRDEQVPDDVELPSDAAAMAQEYLADYLAFPPEACVDLEDIDTCPEAQAWGSTSWLAFRALHAYAESVASGQSVGNFWTWCENSKHPLAWRATSKKLSMVESDTVKNTKKYRDKRVFPVDLQVDPTGKKFMEAHIKIAEGGGPLAPRIYFLHSAATKKMHVGYFGPHRNVPNSRA
jgi:hypothetical protein